MLLKCTSPGVPNERSALPETVSMSAGPLMFAASIRPEVESNFMPEETVPFSVRSPETLSKSTLPALMAGQRYTSPIPC